MTEPTTNRAAQLRTAGAVVLAVLAFAGSFDHVRATVAQHGQTGWLAVATAAMPELMVLLCVARLRDGQADAATWLVGGSAVGFTISANLAQAEPTPWGYFVAGFPAWAAVSSVLLLHAPKPRPDAADARVEPVKPQPQRQARHRDATPVTPPAKPQPQPEPVRPHLVTPAAADAAQEAPEAAGDAIVTWLQAERAARPLATREELLAAGMARFSVSMSTMERRWARAFPKVA